MADSGNQMSGRFSHFYTDCLSSFSALHMDLTQYLLLTFVTQCKALEDEILRHSIRNKTKNVLLFCLFSYSLDSVSCDLYDIAKLHELSPEQSCLMYAF